MRAARALIPPVLIDALRALRTFARNSQLQPVESRHFNQSECRALTARMDAGDYTFDAETAERMCAMWRADPASAPYPSALTRAYEVGDVIAMNAKPLMEVTYRLPYSRAYESTQRTKYESFVAACVRAGVRFDQACVADIGCGYGGLLEIVREQHPSAQLVGAECAVSAIEQMAQERPHIHSVLADIEAATPEFVAAIGAGIDVVLCTEVLEHLRRPEHALSNLMALHPSRGIALTVPNGRVDTAAQHINFWSPESWSQFINRHADGWRITCDRCPSPGSPGGFDNLAVLLPA